MPNTWEIYTENELTEAIRTYRMEPKNPQAVLLAREAEAELARRRSRQSESKETPGLSQMND